MLYLGIAIAGAVGALCRWFLSVCLGRTKSGFDIGTLSVNALGSLIFGLIVGLSPVLPSSTIQVMTIGFCGGLTTFSTFCVSVVSGMEKGKFSVAWKELGFNILACILLIMAGTYFGELLCK